MKKLLLVIVAFTFSVGVFAQGIEFEHGTLDEALAKAKAENKMVFMDCFTVWCSPCKFLSSEVFPQNEVGDYFNANFVSIKMDMEKGEGIELRKKYGVKAYPTLLWLDAEGNIQHKALGGMSAPALIEAAKTAFDTEKSWKSFTKKYNNGERSIPFLQEYILTAKNLREDVDEAAEAYYAQRTNEKLVNAKDLEIMSATIKSVNDKKFTFVMENKANFKDVVGEATINNFIEKTMEKDLNNAMRTRNEETIAQKKKELIELDEEVANKLFALMELQQLFNDPDQNKFLNGLADYALKYVFDDAKILNQYAWMIVDAKIEVKEDILQKALEIAKRAVKLHEGFVNLNTYAYALYKVGEIDEAMKMAKKSVDMASEEERKDLWSQKCLNGEL